MFKIIRRLLLFGALCVPWATQAQSLSDYQLSVDTTTFTSIASTGTAMTFTSNDDGYASALLPFQLFYGEDVFPTGSPVACSANGFIWLGESSTSSTTGSYDGSHRTICAVFNQDGHMGRNTGAAAYYYYDATAETFTIEYHLLGLYSSPYGAYSYQVVFHTNGDIEIVYDSVNIAGGSPSLATFLVSSASDKIFLTGAWAAPSADASYATRPTTDLPVHGLRYTLTRPVLSCPKPRNLQVNATVASALLNWTLIDTNSSVMVQYKPDTADTWSDAGTVTGSSTMLTYLLPGTAYTVRVAALCNGDVDTSLWVSSSFSTANLGCALFDETTMDTLEFSDNLDNTSYYIPIGNYYNYSYTQQLFSADEMDSTSRVLTGLDFYYSGSSTCVAKTDVVIYLANTETESLSSSFVPYSSSFVPVFSGSMNCTTGWNHFEFDTPFHYDGNKNLLVVVQDNSGDYDGTAYRFGVHEVTGKSRYVQNDGSAYDITNVPSGSSYGYRANTKFYAGECEMEASCATPFMALGSVDTSSVSVSWIPGYQETSWELWYRDGNSGAITVAQTNVTDLNYTFTNLIPATTYTFYVVNICENDTLIAELSTTTSCAPVNNIFEDYNNYSTGTNSQINPCWTKRYSSGNSSTSYPYVTTVSGEKVLYFYGYTSGSTNDYSWVATPMMSNDSLNVYEMDFDMMKTSSSSYYASRFLIGAMSDPTDISTFDTIAQVDASVANMWESKNVSLENYHGDARYIAILAPAPGIVDPAYSYAYNYVYLDNLYIGVRRNCPKPTRFHARDITNTSAQLAWDGNDSYVDMTVLYNTVNDQSTAVEATVSENGSADLTGLTPSTTYYCWLIAECSDDFSRPTTCSFTTAAACNTVTDLTVSDVTTDHATVTWVGSPITPASSYTVTWKPDTASTWNTATTTNNFYFLTGLGEGTDYTVRIAANCDENTSSDTVSASFATVTSGTIGTNDGTFYLPTYPLYGYSISEQLWTASELGGYGDTIRGISFFASSSISGRDMKIWVTDTNLSDLSTSAYVPSTSMTLVLDSTMDITSGWNYFPFNEPYVRNTANNLVVLAYDETDSWQSFNGFVASNSTVNSLYDYRDGTSYSTTNLSSLSTEHARAMMRLDADFNTPTCVAPHVVVSASDENSVTLTWVPGLNETSWSVDYRQLGTSTWTNAVTSTSNTTFTVSGLDLSTNYVFRVGSLCSDATMYATVNGSTACGTFTVPFFEDFESYNNGEYNFDPCWYKGNMSSGDMPYVIEITNVGNTALLPPGSFMIFPQMNEPVNQLQVRMQYVVADTSIYAVVGVCSHPRDLLSLTIIDTIRADAAGEAQWVTVTLDSYQNEDGYICIYSNYNQSYYDNIYIEKIPMCRVVDSVTISNITSTSADLTWIGGDNNASYIVEYAPLGDSVYNTVATGSASLQLSNLLHSTTYEARVYGVCPIFNDTTIARIIRFNTECDTVSLPYFEDFEHCNAPAMTMTGMLPNCWNYMFTNTSAYYTTTSAAPQLTINTSYASSGIYSLYTYGQAITLLPKMPVVASQLQLSFHDYLTSPSYYALEIGVCDSNWGNFADSWVAVDTLISDDYHVNFTTYKLANYTGSGQYIGFRNIYRTSSSSDYSYNYIDDISVDYLPSCLPVYGVTSPANTTNSITIDWNSFSPNVSEWEVAYDSVPLNDPSLGTVINTATHPVTIAGLTSGVDYYIYVRAICGDGDTSMWSDSYRGTPGSWTMRANMTDTLYMCGGVIYDDGGNVANGYANSQESYIILYPDTVTGLVVLNGTVATETNYDRITIYDGVGTTGTELFRGDGAVVDITSTSGPLTINFHTDGSVNNYAGFELFVSCLYDNCPVSDIILDSTVAPSNTSLSVTWDGSAASYEVVYGLAGFDLEGTDGTATTVTTNSITITDLTPLTNYDVYVRATCTNGDSGLWHKATFMTPLCDNVVVARNYVDTMFANTSNYSPIGYSFYNYSYTQTIIDAARMAEIGNEISAFAFDVNTVNAGSTYFNNMTVYLANVPDTDLASGFILPNDSTHVFVKVIDSANFSFTGTGLQMFQFDTVFTWDGVSNILFAVQREDGDYASAPEFAAHEQASDKTRYVYNDEDPYDITSVSGGSTSDYVGDIYLYSCGAGCTAPALLPVTDLTYDGATINWNSTATNFEVAVKAASDAEYPEPTAVSGATSFAVTGLTPATVYRYQVRAICDETEGLVSDWKSGTFTTDSLPCFAPSNMQVTDIDMNTVTLDWTVNGEETAWRIHVWNTNFDQTYDVTSHPATVTGLTKNTEYNAVVMALCGGGILESEASDTVTFTTPDCPVPTNVAVSGVTTHSATINWNGTAASYTLEYGSEGYPQGDGTTIANVTGNSYELTDLIDGYAYDVYVMANCDEHNSSDWSAKATFTTLVGINGVQGSMVTLYPNPTSNSTTITLSGVNGDVTIAIVDMNGRTVRSETMNCEGDCAKTMQVDDLAQGAYFVRISGDNVNMVKKLVVK